MKRTTYLSKRFFALALSVSLVVACASAPPPVKVRSGPAPTSFDVSEGGVRVQIPSLPYFALKDRLGATVQGSSGDGLNASMRTVQKASASACLSFNNDWFNNTVVRTTGPAIALESYDVSPNATVKLFSTQVMRFTQLRAYVIGGTDQGQCYALHFSQLAEGDAQQALSAWQARFRGLAVKVSQDQ